VVIIVSLGWGIPRVTEAWLSVSKALQSVYQIARIRGLKVNSLTGNRVFKVKLDGVQPLSLKMQFGSQSRIGAVHSVTNERVSEGREVDSNLVSATGFENHLNERCGTEHF
jgi:hypothetical protein